MQQSYMSGIHNNHHDTYAYYWTAVAWM